MIKESWQLWVVIYIISTVLFAQEFKRASKKMKNPGTLTILSEIFTALFSILLIPLFPIKFPTDINIYLTLGIVTLIYAIIDRLNLEARYGLDPSTFSMLKQLSTVFMIIAGLVLLKEQVVLKKLIGAFIIVFANVILAYNKGKLKLNKYCYKSMIASLLSTIAMLINVGISNSFNLPIYNIITVSVPSIVIFIIGKHNIKELKKEFNLYDKKRFLLATFNWSLMLVSSIRAYQLGNVVIIAPLFAVTSIINAFIEYIINHDKNKLTQKLIAAVLIIIGILLIKI